MKEQKKSMLGEIHLRQILDRMIEGVQIIGFDYRHLYVNDAIEKQSHFSKDELIGYTMMERYPGIEQSAVFAVLKECMETRMPKQIEIDFEFPDKRKAWFELSIQPVEEGIFILSLDVTARKLAEAEIKLTNQQLEEIVSKRTAELEQKVRQFQESEEKFQKAFHSSAAGITLLRTRDSVITDVNQAFTRITGFTREEAIGKSPSELGIVDEKLPEAELDKQFRTHGFIRDFETTVRNKSGRTHYVISSIELIAINNEYYALSVMYDITERRKTEEQVHALNKELEAFSYSVSHDLRAPLRSIIGYSEILEEDLKENINESLRKSLNTIKANAKKMGVLIDELLAFSRLGKKELALKPIDMNSVVRECITSVCNNGSYDPAVITLEDLPVAEADVTMIAQVWMNLISNAFKYSSKVNAPKIEIGWQRRPDQLVFFVRDNGIGFDMKYIDKLFGVFSRLHKQSEFEGVGVGLSIVKRIVNRHGGDVWADAKLNEGAVFYFSLPDTPRP